MPNNKLMPDCEQQYVIQPTIILCKRFAKDLDKNRIHFQSSEVCPLLLVENKCPLGKKLRTTEELNSDR